MDQAEKLSITLPASLARVVREKVESGAYASNSEVIRDALRAWQEQSLERNERLKAIRNSIQEAIDDPRPSIPAGKVFRDLKKLHERTDKVRRRGK